MPKIRGFYQPGVEYDPLEMEMTVTSTGNVPLPINKQRAKKKMDDRNYTKYRRAVEGLPTQAPPKPLVKAKKRKPAKMAKNFGSGTGLSDADREFVSKSAPRWSDKDEAAYKKMSKKMGL